ncbi:MAG: hypothetical protein RR376_11860 [Janthinobacterium sp.]
MSIKIYEGVIESLGEKWNKGCYLEYANLNMVGGVRVRRRFLVTEEMDDILQEVLQSGEKVKLHMTIMTQDTRSGALLALERANGVVYALNPPAGTRTIKAWMSAILVLSLLTLPIGAGFVLLAIWWSTKKKLASTYALYDHLNSLQGAIRVDQDLK